MSRNVCCPICMYRSGLTNILHPWSYQTASINVRVFKITKIVYRWVSGRPYDPCSAKTYQATRIQSAVIHKRVAIVSILQIVRVSLGRFQLNRIHMPLRPALPLDNTRAIFLRVCGRARLSYARIYLYRLNRFQDHRTR